MSIGHGRGIKVFRKAWLRTRNHANFSIVRQDETSVTIRDEGPWDEHLSVTNDAEWVVGQMIDSRMGSHALAARRLFYYDSTGDLDELLVKDGRFAGFAPGPK